MDKHKEDTEEYLLNYINNYMIIKDYNNDSLQNIFNINICVVD